MADKRIEILAPAGDMERLTMALHYGADAVYLAGERFGMRAAAGNFSEELLPKAVKMAHESGTKVYVTCNNLVRNNEVADIPQFLAMLSDIGADAVIAADIGVMAMSKKYAPKLPIHISTQAGIVNYETAKTFYDMGACRVILARELSLSEIAEIRAKTPAELELEAFGHGAMCMSFSGRCLLSNYLTHRDANRGACAQPCRWKYHLVESQRPNEYMEITEDGGTFIMNSRDMCMIEHIPEMMDAGVTSLKIEGRMKSAYYAAVVTNAYRHAADFASRGEKLPDVWRDEVNKVSHREYSTGFFFGEPGQYYKDSMYFSDAEVCAVVEGKAENGLTRLTQRNKFWLGDTLELVTRENEPIAFEVTGLFDAEGNSIESTPHPMMEFMMKLPVEAEPLSIIRKV